MIALHFLKINKILEHRTLSCQGWKQRGRIIAISREPTYPCGGLTNVFIPQGWQSMATIKARLRPSRITMVSSSYQYLLRMEIIQRQAKTHKGDITCDDWHMWASPNIHVGFIFGGRPHFYTSPQTDAEFDKASIWRKEKSWRVLSIALVKRSEN